jgi:uncharacterized membrane protein YhhN
MAAAARMMVAATLVCAAATLVLVYAEYRHDTRMRRISKPIASGAFIALGVLASAWTPCSSWIVAGLVLGAIGDVALLGTSERSFLAGLVAFLLGHIAYVVAIAELVPPAHWLAPLALAPLVIGAGALAWLWPHLGSMKGPVIVYVVTIVTMVAGALAVRQPLLTTGAVLFFASDLAVARDKFVAAGFTNRAWGLPCYYAGQVLIAWSLAS